eukprot:scaffold1548_cov354-Prasinococcus_capsulatus_cf.AAC.1
MHEACAAHAQAYSPRRAPRPAVVSWLLSLAVLSAKLGCRARHHKVELYGGGTDRCYTAAPSDGLGGE